MKVLFVCLGNICRSPLLHQLLQKQVQVLGLGDKIIVDSAAITSWNLGEEIDARMRKISEAKGIFLDAHSAKLFHTQMFQDYAYIFAVTKDILETLKQHATPKEQEKLFLATHFSPTYKDLDIQDPYYGEESHFEEVFDMCQIIAEELARKLLTAIFK